MNRKLGLDIELLNNENRESFYKNIPVKTLRDRVYKRVKSLKNNITYYIIEGNPKTRELYCYIDYGHDNKREIVRTYYWELQDNDCYIDKDFKQIKLKQLIELLNK